VRDASVQQARGRERSATTATLESAPGVVELLAYEFVDAARNAGDAAGFTTRPVAAAWSSGFAAQRVAVQRRWISSASSAFAV